MIDKNTYVGFCLNSRRWLPFLFYPLKTCSLPEEHLTQCERCGYFQLRLATSYVVRKYNQLKDFFEANEKNT